LVIKITNIVSGSCKRQDNLRGKKVERVDKELGCDKLKSAWGLNQEINIKRAWDKWFKRLHYSGLL